MERALCPSCVHAVRDLLMRAYYPLACMLQPFAGGASSRAAKKLDEVSLSDAVGGAADSAAFAEAAALVQQQGGGLPNATRLRLYALYKQALTGDAPTDPRSASGWDVAAKLKWQAWTEVQGMSRTEARKLYTRLVHAQLQGGSGAAAEGYGEEESVWDHMPDEFRMGGAVVSRMVAPPAAADGDVLPLHAAAQSGDACECRALIDAGHAVNEADEDDHIALHWAADAGHVDAARCLLDLGADVDAQNADGSTPLHMACACEQLEVATLLCERGASLGIKDGDGQLPSDLAPAAMLAALRAAS